MRLDQEGAEDAEDHEHFDENCGNRGGNLGKKRRGCSTGSLRAQLERGRRSVRLRKRIAKERLPPRRTFSLVGRDSVLAWL